MKVSLYSIHVQFLICYKKWIFKEEGLYEILITMNSQRCWIVNVGAKMLIVKRFFMKSAKYCNSWLAIHWFWCTAYWMGSMYRYQCCHYSVFFNMVFFFVLYIFVWMLYHKIIMWSNLEYINCCVCCYGDDETAIFFLFWHFLYSIFYIKDENWLKEKKKRK